MRDCARVADAPQTTPLRDALHAMLRHPLTLARERNWKAAVFSAMLRGVMFFLTNLHAGAPFKKDFLPL